MEIEQDEVNPWVEPQLFRGPAAAITLTALVDNSDGTVLFVVESKDPISAKLIALWSSSPWPVDQYLTGMHEAHRQWLEQLWDASGPFA